MQIKYLTEFDQMRLDPTGNARAKCEILKHGTEFVPGVSHYMKTESSNVIMDLKNFNESLLNSRHKYYAEFNLSMLSKTGPQGRSHTFTEVMDALKPYFEVPHFSEIPVALQVGRDLLLRYVDQALDLYGPPADWEHEGVTGTFAGVPTCLKKGDYHAESMCQPWEHAYPTMIGIRDMRNSMRLIFMDSLNNLRKIEGKLGVVRNWLKTCLPKFFGSWLNPMSHVAPTITDFFSRKGRKTSVEIDYKKMDQNFTWPIVAELVLPLYEHVIGSNGYLHFAAAVEECFKQDIYMGNYVISGEHSLLSGLGFTNDFETIYSVELQLGVAAIMDLIDHVEILALGDDALALLSRCTDRVGYYYADMLIDTSNQVGMCIHPIGGKTRINAFSERPELRYLKRQYYSGCARTHEGMMLGSYPTLLAANSCIYPERAAKTEGLHSLACLQRMDNCWDQPDYRLLLDIIRRYSKNALQFTPTDVENRSADWWERVFGERWNPDSSISFRIINNLTD